MTRLIGAYPKTQTELRECNPQCMILLRCGKCKMSCIGFTVLNIASRSADGGNTQKAFSDKNAILVFAF